MVARSLRVVKFNSNIDELVKPILFQRGRETVYRNALDRQLSIYVKDVGENENGRYGIAYIDILDNIIYPIRDGDQLRYEKKVVIKTVEVRYNLFPPIISSDGRRVLDNVLVVFPASYYRYLNDAVKEFLGKSAGKTPFLNIKFVINRATVEKIRNRVKDIVRITADGKIDDRLHGLMVKGVRIYETNEFNKALKAKVRSIGIRINNIWFLVSSEGNITTYNDFSWHMFVYYSKYVLKLLLESSAITF